VNWKEEQEHEMRKAEKEFFFDLSFFLSRFRVVLEKRLIMRKITIALGIGALLFVTGCPPFQKKSNPDFRAQVPPSGTPTAPELVASLNDNAHKIQSVGVRYLDIDCAQGAQSVGLRGWMYCQKPKSFRMSASLAGNTEVDMGSNDQEFWYWIRRNEPPFLFHCSHEEFAKGRINLQVPFQPEWIMEALGMAEYDPNKQYQVVANRNTIELIEPAVLPQGQRVNKVTVFTRGQEGLQVTGHILKDAQNKDICTATVVRSQKDAGTGATLPKVVQLKWEAEHVKMELHMQNATVNAMEGQRNHDIYVRPNMKDITSYDLARGGVSLGPPGGVRRLSGEPIR
jgi:hypothetical protein